MNQELQYYTKQKLAIPFKLFLKYKDQYNSLKKVEVNCKHCNNRMEMVWNRLKNRDQFIDEEICWKCVAKFGTQNRFNIPEELQFKGSKDNPILWDDYLKYKDIYKDGCKKWIKIQCTECNKEKLIQWVKVRSRNYSKDLQICNNCINKYKSNIDEVKEINSKAQSIAQNRPEVLEKQKLAQKRLMEIDDKYIEKRTNSPQYLTGYYNGIYFASSWELSFLVYCEGQVEKCHLKIPYKYNQDKVYYFPDYVLNTENGKMIVEIKGYINDTVQYKIEEMKEYMKSNTNFIDYKILYYNELKQLPNFKFYNSYSKLQTLDQSKLQINHYPKSWKII
jgi:protein-arginine kinase activator protein McsA